MPIELMLSSRVDISEDVLCQELQGEAVLLNLKTGVYFGLDSVGARVWRLLGERPVLSETIEALLAEYDVPKERCAQDLIALVSELAEHGLVRLG